MKNFLEKPAAKIGYNSHGAWSTLWEIYEVEALERGNSTFDDIPLKWIEENGDAPAIWVCYEPEYAYRYCVEAETMEYSLEKLKELYPEAIEVVDEIELEEGMYVISDDGDEGYLVVDLR